MHLFKKLYKKLNVFYEETLPVSVHISYNQEFSIYNAKHMSSGHPAYLRLYVLQIVNMTNL
jgi:hypothetical protein